MAEFLIASVVLTIVLNLVIRLPGVRQGVERWMTSLASGGRRGADPHPGSRLEPPTGGRPRVQVFFPWKAMLIASVVLTVVLNLAIVLF